MLGKHRVVSLLDQEIQSSARSFILHNHKSSFQFCWKKSIKIFIVIKGQKSLVEKFQLKIQRRSTFKTLKKFVDIKSALICFNSRRSKRRCSVDRTRFAFNKIVLIIATTMAPNWNFQSKISIQNSLFVFASFFRTFAFCFNLGGGNEENALI